LVEAEKTGYIKRHGYLWDQLISFENLARSAKKAASGKRGYDYVRRFSFNLEIELIRLQGEVRNKTYCPGPFRSHWITRPKPRMISVAPFRDRVVHHAVMNLLEPILEKRFHHDSYARRKGKGTRAAVDRLRCRVTDIFSLSGTVSDAGFSTCRPDTTAPL
jgi:RNA-directed DNA polymerase